MFLSFFSGEAEPRPARCGPDRVARRQGERVVQVSHGVDPSPRPSSQKNCLTSLSRTKLSLGIDYNLLIPLSVRDRKKVRPVPLSVRATVRFPRSDRAHHRVGLFSPTLSDQIHKMLARSSEEMPAEWRSVCFFFACPPDIAPTTDDPLLITSKLHSLPLGIRAPADLNPLFIPLTCMLPPVCSQDASYATCSTSATKPRSSSSLPPPLFPLPRLLRPASAPPT